ncbi:MAG: hypothetical protein JKY37_30000 [Nannocystaceae bacterium]|nr:hypothetical protein [Nannocystaceae bacterium]
MSPLSALTFTRSNTSADASRMGGGEAGVSTGALVSVLSLSLSLAGT